MTREGNKMKPLMVARKTYAFPNNVLNIETVNDSKFTKRRNKHNTHNFINLIVKKMWQAKIKLFLLNDYFCCIIFCSKNKTWLKSSLLQNHP